MAQTIRGRRCKYDNVAAGSDTGAERTVAGDTVSVVELHGGGTATSTTTGDVNHTNVAQGVSVSDQAVLPENMTQGTGFTDERLG